jgi:uncharacterized paraquat-inducible protein A
VRFYIHILKGHKLANLIHCWACGKEIHETASTCPHCGANQKRGNQAKYSTYSEIPWYRRNWFAILSGIFFAPALFFIALTGDIYYQRNGSIKTYSKLARFFLVVIFFIPTIIFILLIFVGIGSNTLKSQQDISISKLVEHPEGIEPILEECVLNIHFTQAMHATQLME